MYNKMRNFARKNIKKIGFGGVAMKISAKKPKKRARSITLGFIFILIFSIYGGYQYYNYLKLPVDSNNFEKISINIPRGASTSKIAVILKDNGLIKNELYFRYLSRQRKVGGKYKAGDYKLDRSMNLDQIIEKLINGEVYVDTVRFTIPEGFEIRQIVDRLANHDELNINREKLLDIIENEDFDFEFLSGVPKGKNRLEGYLFPDTYEVVKDIDEKELITRMLSRFDKIFKKEHYDRSKELNMSVKDVIVLASIIEREARVDSERSVISSVFHNRLKRNRLLQSCATVQYALGERKKRLTTKDLEINSPYNTYKYIGLPPRPIASPGKRSIEAALYPDITGYMYFVAKGDGSHVFSKTYKEHLRAKNRYN